MKLRNIITFTFLIMFQLVLQRLDATPQRYSDILNYRVKRDASGPCVGNLCPTGYHCEEKDYVCLPGTPVVDHTETPEDSNENDDNGNANNEKSVDANQTQESETKDSENHSSNATE
ncbi:hypothetical protein Ddc_13394 [Ditylenchus destructor]|nr:hypothetical protein Ddc_13394 [Ditylenchus destructor]